MLICLALKVLRRHPDAAQVSKFYEMSWRTNQHCETEYGEYEAQAI